MKKSFFGWLIIFLLMAGISNAYSAELLVRNPGIEDIPQISQPKGESAREDIGLGKEYLKSYILDTKTIVSSPLHWENQDWIKASLIIGMTIGLYTFDQDIHDWVQRNRNKTSDETAKVAKLFGDGRYMLPPLGLLYLYGCIAKSGKAEKTALLSLESVVVSGMFTQIIKFAGHRHRPSDGDAYNKWSGPGFSTSNLSFPSGHTQTAFAIATVVASEYEDKALIAPLAYGIATLTALSRINDNAHWSSDVFLGAAIGYFTAKKIVSLHNKKRNMKISILPVINGRISGLVISYNF